MKLHGLPTKIFCAGGQITTGAVLSKVMTTVSEKAEQGGKGELVTVHTKIFGPAPRPVTVDVGEDGDKMVPAPETSVHIPVPYVKVFPARVAVFVHTNWSGPARAKSLNTHLVSDTVRKVEPGLVF